MSIRLHIPALILAAVIGVAAGLPQFLFIQNMGPAYQGIFPTTSNDDYYYEARAQEVRDGYPTLGNPFLYEYRDADPVAFWLPDAFLSLSGGLLGLSVQHTFAMFDFLLPPILFLITYLLLLSATGNRLWSLLSAAAFHLGLFLEAFVRSPSPQLNFLFVELVLLFALHLVQSKPYAKFALAAALGALFYVYPYYWTYIFGATGMFFLATLVRKDLRPFSLPLFVSLAAGTLIGLPALVQMLGSGSSIAYQETIYRLGMIDSHTPAGLNSILLSTGALFLVSIIMYLFPESRRGRVLWFMASTVLGGILAANNQIVTGKNLEFSSHYFLPVVYGTFIACVCAAYFVYSRMKSLLRQEVLSYVNRGIGSVVVVAISVGGANAFLNLSDLSVNEITTQRYAPVLAWLKENAVPESVVMADEHASVLIAAYTPLRVFYTRQANLHVMTNEEAWTRVLLQYHRANLTDDFFQNHVGQIFGAHYFDAYGHTMQLNKIRKLFGLPQESAEVIPNAAKEEFRNFAAELDTKSKAELYSARKVDYVLEESDFTMPQWVHIVYPDAKVVFEIGQFRVYVLGELAT